MPIQVIALAAGAYEGEKGEKRRGKGGGGESISAATFTAEYKREKKKPKGDELSVYLTPPARIKEIARLVRRGEGKEEKGKKGRERR